MNDALLKEIQRLQKENVALKEALAKLATYNRVIDEDIEHARKLLAS